jgi:TonB family protein
LFQVALETAHFYHPVVRWISRDVTNEREICCDQLALARSGGSRREFVTMLAALGEVRVHQHRLLLAANGGQLLERAQLMMLPPRRVARARKGAYAMAFVSCAAVLMVSARLQRLRAEVGVGADTAISQLQALVLPASIALAEPGSAWVVPDVVRIPFASANLVAARLEHVPHSLASPKPINLPGPTAAAVPDLRLGGMQVPILRVVPATAAPAVATDAPVPIRVRQPVYPPGALSRGIEGHVTLEFKLDADGSVRDLRRISSTPAGVFDEAALDAMRFWKYAIPNGAASRRYRQILSFTLGGRRAASKNSTTASARDIQARPACQIPTGTHICRWPDDADSSARVVVDGSP